MTSPTPQVPSVFCKSAEKRSAGITNDGENGNKENASQSYLLKYDEPLVDLRDALFYSGLPVMNDEYVGAPWMLVNSKEVETFDGYLVFFVTVNYEVPPIDDFDPDPTNKPWVMSTDVREEAVILENDFDDDVTHFYNKTGNPFKNSFGDWFDPPYQDVEYLQVINFTKNVSTWVLSEGFTYQNKINDADITVAGFLFPTHCLLCSRYTTPGKQQSETSEFYVKNIQLIYKEPKIWEDISVVDRTKQNGANNSPILGNYTNQGWDILVVDRGFNCRLTDENGTLTGKKGRHLGEDGKPSKNPSLLDGTGRAYRNNEEYDPVYIPFQPKEDADFSTMNLPSTVP